MPETTETTETQPTCAWVESSTPHGSHRIWNGQPSSQTCAGYSVPSPVDRLKPYESDACWANVHHDCTDPLCLCQHHRAQVWDPWDEAWKAATPAQVQP